MPFAFLDEFETPQQRRDRERRELATVGRNKLLSVQERISKDAIAKQQTLLASEKAAVRKKETERSQFRQFATKYTAKPISQAEEQNRLRLKQVEQDRGELRNFASSMLEKVSTATPSPPGQGRILGEDKQVGFGYTIPAGTREFPSNRTDPLSFAATALDIPRKEAILPVAERLIPGDVQIEDLVLPRPLGPLLRSAGAPGTGVAIPERTAEEITSFAAEAASPGVGPVGGVLDVGQFGRRGVSAASGLKRAEDAFAFSDEAADVARGADELVEEAPSAVDKLTEILETGRKNIQTADVTRSAQRAERSARADAAFRNALDRGLSRQEAFALSRAELKGELAPVAGVTSALDEADRVELFDAVRQFDFGRGPDTGYASKNAVGALLKIESNQPLRNHEIDLLGRVFGDRFAEAAKPLAKQSLGDQIFDILVLPKAVKSSFDMSAPLRQNIMLAPRRSREFIESFGPMIKAFGSERYARDMTEAILNDPTTLRLADGTTTTFGDFAQETGLIRALDPALDAAEENFRSQLAERIPLIGRVVRASNRAFTSFGNEFRGNVARQVLREWGHVGGQRLGNRTAVALTPDRLEGLSRMLNRFTGRGTLLDNNNLTRLLQATWWSPQYRLSGPEAFAQMFHKDGAIRRAAIENTVSFFATGMSILTAAKLSGQFDVNVDPRSTDFGKVVLGDNRWNFWGTNQTLVRTLARVLTSERLDPNLGPVSIARGDVIRDYFRSGLAPEWGATWNIISGRDYLGDRVKADADGARDQVEELFLPLIFNDLWDSYENNGLIGALVGPVSFFGGTVQTYPDSAYQQLGAIPEFTGGLEPKQIKDIKKFHEFATRARNEWGLDPKYGPEYVERISFEDTLRYLGEQQEKSENFIEWAVLLRPGSSSRAELRNPAWVQFAAEHADEIFSADENDYPPNYIKEAIVEMERSAAP